MKACRYSCHPGFSLVELLVVIAIIGIMMGLLVPAVQRVREAGNRVTCANNLKQIALATHGFEQAQGSLPRDTQGYQGVWRTWSAQATQRSWSWLARTLPYLEESALYREANIPDNTLGQSRTAIAKSVRVLFCPSDHAVVTNW